MPNPTDWLQIYQHTLSEQPQTAPPSTTVFGGSQLSDATVVTTTTSSTSLHHHGPLGRGSRTIRRRSRASRRTPTTVFNTNTTNFRAMVQQFTGSHSEPFSFSGLESDTFGSRNINLHQQIVNPNTTPSAYNIQFQQEVQQIFPYTNPPSQDHTIGHEAFFHRLGNSSSRSNMEVSENLIMDDRTLFPPQHQRGQK
uniref:VQ motif-containing protein 22-like n=1 Tax=Nicotiana tabacum TaxID=4097 RepID=A0A1S3ZT32_TOBAC|nr:PREDICTED: VQ motif-containing protein 22-like [Nicotiana tabacum]